MTLDNAGAVRRSAYVILIIVAVSSVAGKVLSIARVYEPNLFRAKGDTTSSYGDWPEKRPEPMPTLGANDRSRWVTIRTLVDEGTYVIGQREYDPADPKKYKDTGPVSEDGWGTIDKVMPPGSDRFYSSKPPFIATIMAGEYWLLKKAFGWSIVNDRYWVVRAILLTFNVLPFIFYLWFLAKLIDQWAVSDWTRLFLLTAAGFATLITPFLVSLNNHTLAAFCGLIAVYATLARTKQNASEDLAGPDPSAPGPGRASAAGLFAGLAFATELPAAALLAGLLVIWLTRRSLACVLAFVLAALIPIGGFFVTNKIAIGQYRPAYGEFGGKFYEYEGSHWNPEPAKQTGIDWAGTKESREVYAFHMLLGHHGLFSLTPIFILGVVGALVGLCRLGRPGLAGSGWIHLLTLGLTTIVIVFYVVILPDRNRNYGGWTCGPRWLIWLTPFLLLSAAPALDFLATRKWGRWNWGRCFAYVLLIVSVLSASYPAWNPWRHPWLYNFINEWNLINY